VARFAHVLGISEEVSSIGTSDLQIHHSKVGRVIEAPHEVD